MGASYTIVWTPSGLGSVTLCDLSQGWWPEFEQWPQEAVEQMDRLAFGGSVFRQMRGNVSGDCVFKVGKSHANRDVAAAWFQAMAACHANSVLVGIGQLVVTIGATVWSYSAATFKRIEPMKMNGSEWWLRYSFGVTQMDAPSTDGGSAETLPPATDPTS